MFKKKIKKKGFTVTLEVKIVKDAKKTVKDISFSQYVNELIIEDVRKKNSIKSLEEIFGPIDEIVKKSKK